MATSQYPDYSYSIHSQPPPPPPPTYNYTGSTNPRKTIDNSADCCAKVCGLILLTFATTGVVLAYISVFSCKFFVFTVTDSNITFPPGVAETAQDDGSGGRMMRDLALHSPMVGYDTFVETSSAKMTFGNIAEGDKRRLDDVDGTEGRPTVIITTLQPSLEGNLAPAQTPADPPASPDSTLPSQPTPYSPSQPPTDIPFNIPSESPLPSAAPTTFEREAAVGLFQYLDYEEQICFYYEVDSWTSLELLIRIARMGAVLTAFASTIATSFLLLEYCFCRVWCSRVLINSGFILAITGVPLTFLMFTDTRCYPLRTSEYPGVTCEISEGGRAIAFAGICFIVTLILSCVTPKPIPFVRLADDWQRNGIYDDCCDCWPSFSLFSRRREERRRKRALKAISAEDGEFDRLTSDMSLSPDVTDSAGHTYKQYHDENAGYTLQNQYTAAYKRWLAFEADYDDGLSRFKRECAEANVDWRRFMRKVKASKSKVDKSRGIQDVRIDDEMLSDEISVTSSRCNNEVNGNNFNVDDDEGGELFFDEELLRFVDVLTTMRANCDFAKGVMNRIQDDINDHTRREDERKAMIEKQMKDALLAKEKQSGKKKKNSNDGKDQSESQNIGDAINSKLPAQPSMSIIEEGRRSTNETDLPFTTMDDEGDMYASARMNLSSANVRTLLTGSSDRRRDRQSSIAEDDENIPSSTTSPAGAEVSATSTAADRLLRPMAKVLDRVQHTRPKFLKVKIPKLKKDSGSQQEDGEEKNEDGESSTKDSQNLLSNLNPFRRKKDDEEDGKA